MSAKDFENALIPYPHLQTKPITVFIDHPPANLDQLKENPYNILMIMEPNQLFGLHDWAIQHKDLFSVILTWSEKILKTCDNSYEFPFGVTWLDSAFMERMKTQEKSFEVSFLCGAKQRIEGHHLRHRLFKRHNEILIPNKWFYTLEDYTPNNGHHTILGGGKAKEKCWQDSMYSICVENSSNKGYFTEKILDAFLSRTIPIYWGCPDISSYFDISGIIHCSDESNIIECVNQLTPEFYHSKKETMEYNYTQALYYSNITQRFVDKIQEIVTYNGI